MRTILLLLASFISTNIFAQPIRGTVQDTNGNPLPFANVLLLNCKDSLLVKGAVSDTVGVYIIDRVDSGTYLVSASLVGYIRGYSKEIKIRTVSTLVEVAALTLSNDTKILKEVVINERRPFVEQHIDRLVVNVSNSIVSSGSTALEVLEKSPGVTVDRQNDGIQFRGKDGVVIQIDGKQTYLPMTDVVGLLRNMSSDNIDQIELITNPSVKNDAEGNVGIINIKLKKNKNLGTNGSLSLSVGSGRFDRERGGLQLNHRAKKFNVFGNYSVNRGGNYWHLNLKRSISDASGRQVLAQDTRLEFLDVGQNAKAGIDYVVNNTTIGIVWTGLWSDHQEEGPAETQIRRSENDPVYLSAQTDKTLANVSINHVGNINLQHAFGKNGGRLTADVDIGSFRRQFANTLRTETTWSDGSLHPTTSLTTQMPTAINIYTAKVDFSRVTPSNWTFETGFKSSRVWSDNDLTLSQGEIDNVQLDSLLSNHFQYEESINAFYINFSGKLNSKTEAQLGLRSEYTHSESNSITLNNSVKRKYLNLFPSLFLSHALDKNQKIGLSYSYRIDRPNYQSLNPARSYIDPYSFTEGNPYLQPQYTHSLALNHSYKEKIFTSLAANYTKSMFFAFMQPIDSATAGARPQNMGKSQGYNVTINFPIKVMQGWNIQAMLMGLYSQFQYTYLETPFTAQQISGRCNISNSFVLGKNWTAELSGWINTPSRMVLAKSPWLGSMDAGIQKSWDPAWKVKLSFQDVFHTNLFQRRINTPKFITQARMSIDSQLVMLNLTYNFGNQKMKSALQRSTGSEEELKRTN